MRLRPVVASVIVVGVLIGGELRAGADDGHHEKRAPRVTTRVLHELADAHGLELTGINNHGAVIGSIGAVPFVWTAGSGRHTILEAAPGRATAINDRGVVVGTTDTGEFSFNVWRWTMETG